MKLNILSSIAATVLLSAFTTFTTAEKDVIGQWKIDDASVAPMVKHIVAKAVEANPDAEDQIVQAKDQITEMIKSLKLTIKADHTYESVSAQGSKQGKWALTHNERNLEFTRADGTTRKDSVLEITAARLKLINRELGDTTVYVHP